MSITVKKSQSYAGQSIKIFGNPSGKFKSFYKMIESTSFNPRTSYFQSFAITEDPNNKIVIYSGAKAWEFLENLEGGNFNFSNPSIWLDSGFTWSEVENKWNKTFSKSPRSFVRPMITAGGSKVMLLPGGKEIIPPINDEVPLEPTFETSLFDLSALTWVNQDSIYNGESTALGTLTVGGNFFGSNSSFSKNSGEVFYYAQAATDLVGNQLFFSGDPDSTYFIEYNQLSKDCANYYPKLKEGGIFAGHDYNAIAGVRQAADEFAAKVGREIHITECDVWYWIK